MHAADPGATQNARPTPEHEATGRDDGELTGPSIARALICWLVIVLSAVIAVLFAIVMADEQTTAYWAATGAASVALSALAFRPDRPWRWWWLGLLAFLPMIPVWLLGMGALLEHDAADHAGHTLLVVTMYAWAGLVVIGGIALAALRVQRRRARGVAGS